MAILEAQRIFATQAGPSIQKAAEDDLSDTIFGALEEASTRLQNASFFFVEWVSTEMTTKGSLDDMLESYLEQWTQASSCMAAFCQMYSELATRRATCFKIYSQKREKQVDFTE